MFNLEINVKAFLESLRYMGVGMIGIFAVTIVIIISMILLNKFTSKKADK